MTTDYSLTRALALF